MSFLDAIKNRKTKLKETTTVVTQCDGKQYLESKSVILEPIPNSLSYGFIVDTKPDFEPALITNNLYIGSQDATSENIIKKYNITRVLSLGVNIDIKNVTHKFLPCLDLPESDIKVILKESLPFIREGVLKGDVVLVHCNAGVSRTALVAIGYLMQYESMGFEEAYSLVKGKRPAIQPNVGFRQQLLKLKHGELI